jgi:hypothetical protein
MSAEKPKTPMMELYFNNNRILRKTRLTTTLSNCRK